MRPGRALGSAARLHTAIAWGAFGKCFHFEIGSVASRVQSELRATDLHRLGKRNSPAR